MTPGEEEHQRLGTLLSSTLARETRLWRAPVLINACIQVKACVICRLLSYFKLQDQTNHAVWSKLVFSGGNTGPRAQHLPCFVCFQGSDISPPRYHEVIVWMHEMSSVFQFSSETFALAVCVLNRLLASVKVNQTITHLLSLEKTMSTKSSFFADSAEISQMHGHHLSDPCCKDQRGRRGKMCFSCCSTITDSPHHI